MLVSRRVGMRTDCVVDLHVGGRRVAALGIKSEQEQAGRHPSKRVGFERKKNHVNKYLYMQI